MTRENNNEKNYNLEITGASNLYEEDLTVVKKFADNFMKKISRFSNYDNLKITFKPIGNIEGSHKRKIDARLMLSHGKKVLTLEKQISTGTSDELTNNKVKENWNIPLLVQDTFRSLESMVKTQRARGRI
jgi:hypothetical protein